ncbi:MAG TPA: PLP-dependent aminotransferase family protein [Telluria sp.]|jgi:DNA-binding transcriptional MocR family regulator
MQYSLSPSAHLPGSPEASGRLSRYQQIAHKLTAQIDAGVFTVDERLPSVRALMRSESVSVTTAVRVFRALEENGRAYARERSGYYVRRRDSESGWARLPERALPAFDGVAVNVNRHVVQMLSTPLAPDVMPLASANLDQLLLPQSHLSSTLMSIARRGIGHSASFSAVPGLFELRCGVARIMGERGVLCGPDDVLITAGGNAAIEGALRMCARPGDSIAVESPTYFGSLQAIESAGMKAIEIATDPHNGIDLDQLELAIATRKVACVMLNPTLHNPLGFTMPDSHRKRLAALLTKAGVPLIEDDAFHDLYTGAATISAIKRYDQEGLVLYCSSFSKVMGAGYRIGWCLPGRFRRQMTADLLTRQQPVSGLSQLVLAEFVRKNYYGAQAARLRLAFADQQIKMRGLVAQHYPSGTRVSIPEGGYVYWLTLPVPVDIGALYDAAMACGIAIAPGALFTASGNSSMSFRLCIGRQWSARVEQAVAQVGSLCRQMSKRPAWQVPY